MVTHVSRFGGNISRDSIIHGPTRKFGRDMRIYVSGAKPEKLEAACFIEEDGMKPRSIDSQFPPHTSQHDNTGIETAAW